MTVMDDKYLTLRFASQPEFLLRLDDFVASYALTDRPALIVQARPKGPEPIPESVVDKDAFKRGVATQIAWWYGFRSRVGHVATFHGTASLPSEQSPKWASELHRDGHFIAGVWEFPDLPRQGNRVSVLAHFYVELFEHFVTIVNQTLAPLVTKPEYVLTATLTNARSLHFSRKSDFGSDMVFPPSGKANLQWPIFAATVGSEQWSSAAVAMGEALLGASGNGGF